MYKSNTINAPKEIGIDHPLDLAYKLKTFYYYLFSKHRNEIPWHHSYGITFKVILSFNTDEFFTLINEYEMLELKEPFFNHLEVELIDQHLYLQDFTEEHFKNFIKVPFHLVIEVNARYCNDFNNFDQLSVEEEIELEEEILTHDFEPPKLSKSFKTRDYVVCLSKDPSILFYDCRHICVCLECEERNPLVRCPYCRTIAITKISIKKIFYYYYHNIKSVT